MPVPYFFAYTGNDPVNNTDPLGLARRRGGGVTNIYVTGGATQAPPSSKIKEKKKPKIRRKPYKKSDYSAGIAKFKQMLWDYFLSNFLFFKDLADCPNGWKLCLSWAGLGTDWQPQPIVVQDNYKQANDCLRAMNYFMRQCDDKLKNNQFYVCGSGSCTSLCTGVCLGPGCGMRDKLCIPTIPTNDLDLENLGKLCIRRTGNSEYDEFISDMIFIGPEASAAGGHCHSYAESAAKEIYPFNNSKDKNFNLNDSLRHCAWQCCMAKLAGDTNAEMAGRIHEACNPNEPHTTVRDLNNNKIGRDLAQKGFFGSCKEACNDAVESGVTINSDDEVVP